MGCFESYQQMHVIIDPADLLGESAQPVYGATQVFMEARHPFFSDERSAAFCTEDKMVMEAEIGCHTGEAATLPGCFAIFIFP